MNILLDGIPGAKFLFFISRWKAATIGLGTIFFGLSVRWIMLDNSPPAWDQGLYLYQATILHQNLVQNGFLDFINSIFSVDRGRAPLLLLLVQPGFLFFGPSLKVALISINLVWFIIIWALPRLAGEIIEDEVKDKTGFFALLLFGFYPLTIMVSHNFLVEFVLAAFACAANCSLLLLYRLESRRWSILAGLFIGFGLLTKVTFPVFLIPACCILIFNSVRNLSWRAVTRLFWPVVLLPIFIAGPYYFINFGSIYELTRTLSSHRISELYGFGNALDIGTIIQYWRGIFVNGVFYTIELCLAVVILFKLSGMATWKVMDYGRNRAANLTLIFWFFLPFLFGSLGEVKDPRYIYPGLMPIFIYAGTVVARSAIGKMGAPFVAVAYLASLPEYLHANDFFIPKTSEFLVSCLKPGEGVICSSPPDGRDWRSDRLVRGLASVVGGGQDVKDILFLGGNRYYHVKLLQYYGLLEGVNFNYVILPYYSNPSMTLNEALNFIDTTKPAALLVKSGENWPGFLMRLDPKIVSHLKNDSRYTAINLPIEQPDGSRFTLFVPRPLQYAPVFSPAKLIGSWRVAGGVGTIAADSGDGLIITTETRVKGRAMLRDGEIYVADWKVSGKVTLDLNSIYWNNGAIWRKIPSTGTLQ